MNNLMLVLRTMGTEPDAPIVSLSAQLFDPITGLMGPKFNTAITLESEMALGAVADPGAIMWWLRQSSEARSEILGFPACIQVALQNLDKFIRDYSIGSPLNVWSENISENNVILRAAYKRAGLVPFWNSYNDRDVNTIKDIVIYIGNSDIHRKIKGDCASDEAINIANSVSAAWKTLLNTEQSGVAKGRAEA